MSGFGRGLEPYAFALLLPVVGTSCVDLEASSSTGPLFSSSLQADPSSEADFLVDLGRVVAGDRAVQVIEVSNLGGSRLVVTGAWPARPFAHDLPAAGLAIEGGATSQILFAFEPEGAFGGPLHRIIELRTNEGVGRVYTVRLSGQGISAALHCEPSSLDFGMLPQGSSRSLETVCRNEKSVPLEMMASWLHRFSGDQQRFFSASLGAGVGSSLALDPGESVPIQITFSPQNPGSSEAALEIGGPRSAPLATIELEGQVGSAIRSEPSGCLDFGEAALGTQVIRTLTLRNSDIEAIQIQTASLPEEAREAFSSSLGAPIELEPAGGAREIEVLFHPSKVGPIRSSIEFHADDPRIEGGIITSCLQGYGGGASLRCDQEAIDFSQVSVGMSAPASFRCSNDGDQDPEHPAAPLRIRGLASTSDRFRARIVNEDGSEGPKARGYQVGEGFRVELIYEPTAEGLDTAEILIESPSASGGIHSTGVRGQGWVLPPCDFTIEPRQLPFGMVEFGASLTRTVEIRNQLETPCLIYDLRLAEGTTNAFSIKPIRTVDLPGSGVLRVPVTYAPSVKGPALGAIEFQVSNPERVQQRVELSGTGGQACLQLEPRLVDFGIVSPGCQTRDQSVYVTNICSAPSTIRSWEVSETSGATEAFRFREEPPPGQTLHPDERLELPMYFQPEKLGEAHGTVALEVEGSAPYFLSLVGDSSLEPFQRETVIWPGPSKVDVLWVVDTSASFEPYQERIADSLPAFLHAAHQAQADYQIAVTTSGLTTSGSTCPGGALGGEDGRFFPIDGSRPRILRRTTPDLSSHLAHNLRVGSCHASETHLEAAFRALSAPLIDERKSSKHGSEFLDGNGGFLRQEAALSIIFVAEEPDQSLSFGRSIYDYLAFFKGIKGIERLRVHGIVGGKSNDPSSCNRSGDRFHALLSETDGIWVDICTPLDDDAAWASEMRKLSAGAFGFASSFVLRGQPHDRTGDGEVTAEDIEVFVDGERLPPTTASKAHRWVYDPTTNSIRFMRGHQPRTGAEVAVTYPVACGER